MRANIQRSQRSQAFNALPGRRGYFLVSWAEDQKLGWQAVNNTFKITTMGPTCVVLSHRVIGGNTVMRLG